MGIDANKKPAWFMLTDRCNFSGLPITHQEAFVCSDPGSGFCAGIARLGDNIILMKSFGYATSFAESEMLAFIDDFIARHCGVKHGIIYMEDYSGLQGVDSEARKKYITYFKGKTRDVFIGVILYTLPPVFKISFNLAKKLHIYASRAHAVDTYEEAIDLAFKLINQSDPPHSPDHDNTVSAANIGNRFTHTTTRSMLNAFFHRVSAKLTELRFFFTEKVKHHLIRQYSEELLKYIESIDWQASGVQPPESILYKDISLKKVFDAISFVKSEIDSLMEERAAAEMVLQESESKYRLLVEHAKAGFLEYDYHTNRLMSVNDELVKCSGYSEEELLSMNPIDLFTEESQKIFSERLKRILSGEPISHEIIYQCINKNQDILWWMLNADVKYLNGRPDKANVVVTDITSLKQAENKLLEYQEKLKRLSIRLSMAEEDQRRSMASHLHETIGQELFVMQLQLKTFEKSIDNPSFLLPLGKIKEQLLKIIKETKALTFDLSPPVLYDLGLEEALKTLSETIASKYNIRVQTYFDGEMDTIKDEIKAILYRNVKELIHNSVKHANAKTITIRLKNSQNRLYIGFRDDGIGFDAANYKSKKSPNDGFGLFDIKEKLNYLGGHLTIESTASLGTSVTMEVPL
jgi:PAS domain S-box-containing protein